MSNFQYWIALNYFSTFASKEFLIPMNSENAFQFVPCSLISEYQHKYQYGREVSSPFTTNSICLSCYACLLNCFSSGKVIWKIVCGTYTWNHSFAPHDTLCTLLSPSCLLPGKLRYINHINRAFVFWLGSKMIVPHQELKEEIVKNEVRVFIPLTLPACLPWAGYYLPTKFTNLSLWTTLCNSLSFLWFW